MSKPDRTGYFHLCERWWRRWIEDDFTSAPEVREVFALDAAPEPYLTFGHQTRPLCVVTTNPGAPMPHQLRPNIESGDSFLSPAFDYSEAAAKLAGFYSDHLTGAAAARVAAQMRMASDAGFSGVLQVECIPWHSSSLPGKSSVIKMIRRDADLSEYVETLKRFLASRPTLILSAVSSQIDLGSGPIELSPWLNWQTDLVGLDSAEADMVPLTRKNDRITSVALVDEVQTAPKALVLMMGGNHFPSEANSELLVQALARGG